MLEGRPPGEGLERRGEAEKTEEEIMRWRRPTGRSLRLRTVPAAPSHNQPSVFSSGWEAGGVNAAWLGGEGGKA